MKWFELFTVSLTSTATNFASKKYNAKCSGALLYTMLAAVFSAVVFGIFVTNWNMTGSIFIHALYFAIANCTSIFFTVKSYRYGLFSLTVLIISYSLLIPTFYGIIILGEPISKSFVIGLLLVVISIFLTSGKIEKNEGFSLRWIVCVILAFIGGGMCSVTQRMGQIACDNINLLMFTAFVQVAVICGVLGIITEKNDIKNFAKSGWYIAVLGGLLNGITNILVVDLNTKMKASVMFPVISVFVLTVSFLFALLLYREKLLKRQIFGYIIGTISVIVINL